MGHRAAGIDLEGERLGDPAAAEALDELSPFALRGAREAVVEAVRSLEHGARADEARAREFRGADARLRGPARVQPLGPGALGQVFDDAGGHRACNAQCVYELVFRKLEER